MSKSFAAQANTLWQKQPKANAELFALTYGALVGELIRDLESTDQVKEELDRMGHSIGIRCVEEFLAKSDAVRCQTFVETADMLRVLVRMFLGVSAEMSVASSSKDATSYSIILQENPLSIFVELPENMRDLEYSQLLCGLFRGALEMLQYDVNCRAVHSQLKGDDINEISVELNHFIQDGAGDDYQDE